jgi:hypothetical protein
MQTLYDDGIPVVVGNITTINFICCECGGSSQEIGAVYYPPDGSFIHVFMHLYCLRFSHCLIFSYCNCAGCFVPLKGNSVNVWLSLFSVVQGPPAAYRKIRLHPVS